MLMFITSYNDYWMEIEGAEMVVIVCCVIIFHTYTKFGAMVNLASRRYVVSFFLGFFVKTQFS